MPSNLRIVQWQVCRKKQNKLEFLMPWWDLQLGVSVNQFLSIFASKNSDFRYACCRRVPSVRPLAAVGTLPYCNCWIFFIMQKQSIRVLVHPWCQRGAELAAGGGGARVPAALL